MKKGYVYFLKKSLIFFGLILFVLILREIDFQKLITILSKSRLDYIAFVAFLGFGIMFIVAFRWFVILRMLGIDYAFGRAYINFVKGAILGIITPGRLGELYRAKYIVNETSSSLGKALFSVLADRVYDIIMISLLGVTGLIYFVINYTIDLPLVQIIAFPAVLLISVGLMINKRLVKYFLFPLFNFLLSENNQNKAHLHFAEFYDELQTISLVAHCANMLITLIIWFMKLSALFLLTRALGISVSFCYVISFGAIATIVTLLPISISGLGTRDVTFIFFLSLQSISSELAVALSFLYFFFFMWSVAISVALVFGYGFMVSFLKGRYFIFMSI